MPLGAPEQSRLGMVCIVCTSPDFPEYSLGVKQYEEVDIQMESNSAAKNLVDQLEQEYDNRSDVPQSGVNIEESIPLAPDVQQFLMDVGERLDQNDGSSSQS